MHVYVYMYTELNFCLPLHAQYCTVSLAQELSSGNCGCCAQCVCKWNKELYIPASQTVYVPLKRAFVRIYACFSSLTNRVLRELLSFSYIKCSLSLFQNLFVSLSFSFHAMPTILLLCTLPIIATKHTQKKSKNCNPRVSLLTKCVT